MKLLVPTSEVKILPTRPALLNLYAFSSGGPNQLIPPSDGLHAPLTSPSSVTHLDSLQSAMLCVFAPWQVCR